MDPRFPPLAPQPRAQRAASRVRVETRPLPVLPLAEWLVFGGFVLLLALA
ncbi:hypothetical protein [Neotabrizicola sp. sgz301269]